MDFTINTAWESNVSYNGKRIVQKIYRYEKRRKADHLSRTRFTNQMHRKKKGWDRRVKVVFQPKAWYDENIMKSWVSEDWANHFLNAATQGGTGKILLADVHGAQQTSSIK